LDEEWILIPEKLRPWRETDGKAYVHSEENAQIKFSAHQPARDPLLRMGIHGLVNWGRAVIRTACGGSRISWHARRRKFRLL